MREAPSLKRLKPLWASVARAAAIESDSGGKRVTAPSSPNGRAFTAQAGNARPFASPDRSESEERDWQKGCWRQYRKAAGRGQLAKGVLEAYKLTKRDRARAHSAAGNGEDVSETEAEPTRRSSGGFGGRQAP